MARLVCLYQQPGGTVGAVPLVAHADCPGLVVSQSSQTAMVQPSLALMLVLLVALLALALVRRHCEGLRHG